MNKELFALRDVFCVVCEIRNHSEDDNVMGRALISYGVDTYRVKTILARDPQALLEDMFEDDAAWFMRCDREHAELIARGAPPSRDAMRHVLCGEPLDPRGGPIYVDVALLLCEYVGQRLPTSPYKRGIPWDEELVSALDVWLEAQDARPHWFAFSALTHQELGQLGNCSREVDRRETGCQTKDESEQPELISDRPDKTSHLGNDLISDRPEKKSLLESLASLRQPGAGWLDPERCEQLDAFFSRRHPDEDDLEQEEYEEVWGEEDESYSRRATPELDEALGDVVEYLESWVLTCCERGWALATFTSSR